ncbi:hypothetical protein FB446DRAFT_769186 [Lentinula raphanica]|nr:hypothetical protein FB446DRAFT_769186 [Lentinula raphanica]
MSFHHPPPAFNRIVRLILSTTKYYKPLVEAFRPIYAPQVHNPGKFSPFDDEFDLEKELIRLTTDPALSVDAYDFENPRPAPHPRRLPLPNYGVYASGAFDSEAASIARAYDLENPRPAPHPQRYPSPDYSVYERRTFDSEVAPVSHAFGIQSYAERFDSAIALNPSNGEKSEPREVILNSPRHSDTLGDLGNATPRPSEEFCDLFPETIFVEKDRTHSATDTCIADGANRSLEPASWYQSGDLCDMPADEEAFPRRLPALSGERPTFTDPFNGNEEIQHRITSSGSVIYSTERPWDFMGDVYLAALEQPTKRRYFGSDDDEVYVPPGRTIRSRFSD